MEELKVKAGDYAEENVINVLKEAFAKVYADGYCDGYKDCKNKIPVDLCDNQIGYVDLGLPSGTLWSADFLRESENIVFMPHCKANAMNIPTQEQLEELMNTCKWEHFGANGYLNKAVCIGPNGESITFTITAMEKCDQSRDRFHHSLFWLKDEGNDTDKACGDFFGTRYFTRTVSKEYSGYKLPLRLVK